MVWRARILLVALGFALLGCGSAPSASAGTGDAALSDDSSTRASDAFDGAALDSASGSDVASDDAADASAIDAPTSSDAVDLDALPSGTCFLTTVGVFGTCESTSACAALGGHLSTPGYCPGPADIECCTKAPNVADNPPIPSGWKLMPQSMVTSDMTTWAVSILHDPVTYPMFSTTTRMFGTLNVLARVEWHPPDFLNRAIHRGVTLYQPG